jgi:arabinogalactan oligomer/maltooligosaccharide transport system permease protein
MNFYHIKRKSLGVVLTLAAVLLVIAILFPVYWIISSSLRPYATLYTTTFEIIPKGATLGAFYWVLFKSKFLFWMGNSLIVLFLTNLISLLVVCPSAYAFSRFKFVGKGVLLYSFFVLTQAMGGLSIIGLIGLYFLLAHLGMLNSLIVLSFIYAASTVPFNTWFLKTYYDSLPRDLDESALVDGASFFQTLRHVILPIAKPGIFTVIIFTSIVVWSEWVIAGIILSPGNYTVPIGLVGLMGSWETPWNRFAAMAILYSIPIIILFMVSQRYLKQGLTLGAVKG